MCVRFHVQNRIKETLKVYSGHKFFLVQYACSPVTCALGHSPRPQVCGGGGGALEGTVDFHT